MHSYELIDDDGIFVIDPTTRLITCGATNYKCVMQFDHNSEKNTFLLPRVIDGHNMLECNVVCVHYSNISSNKRDRIDDVYNISDLSIYSDDDSYLTCTWIMDSNSTKFDGITEFVITFSCIENGEAKYIWSAKSNPGITIIPGKNNHKLINDSHSDIINTLVSNDVSIQNMITELYSKVSELESKV